MELTLTKNNKSYEVDLKSATCLAIPYNYNGDQPNYFDVPKGEAHPYKHGSFIGKVQNGLGCNVMVLNQNVHCTGTHTECAGHIHDDNIFIHEILSPDYIFTELISISPIHWSETVEHYHCDVHDDEWVITQKMIEEKINHSADGLVVRTLPNSEDKLMRKYHPGNTPFFTTDATEYINELGIDHWVVDLPTIDKYDDGGCLGNHHLFFETTTPYKKTITEFAFVPDIIPDGQYLMKIEIPPMQLDAAPSRPFLFNFMEK
ncbi:MAG: cyclase family protein [Candidatus Marinimicrobia bacterium]|nr:cyclase family protein [Candidatus Neomarinimicrobiota bacterium]MBL7010085.1 cyclase family protein [Candidatus Neomarinimicrobiota bacterium]MBL7030004.1 cyclase family protein [Candidatus Neomarinimicrobiota bacterium]